MSDTTIERFDPQHAGDEAFRARYELETILHAESAPEEPMRPYPRWREAWHQVPSWEKPNHWSAIDSDGRLVGTASLSLEYLETNRNLAWFDIAVHPDARRRGIARRLLRPVVEVGRDDGRTILGAGARENSPGEQFLAAVGADKKSTERKSRLDIDALDLDLMRSWVKRAEERAEGYRLVGWDDRCPDEWLKPFVDLYEVTNTAPRDDLEMDDSHETPERFREREERNLAQGERRWVLMTENAATGDLAGFTELWFSPDHDQIAWQGWTAVHPDHRNLGLGRWLKASLVLRLVDEKPAVRHIDTWNAFSNEPMLNINIAMGFRLIRGYSGWQGATERLAQAAR